MGYTETAERLHGHMEYTADELAGIADLFGGLAREELGRAVDELAFKAGAEVSSSTIDTWIEEAVRTFALVEVEVEEGTVLAPGPTAFPELPDGAADLPHIMDVPRRSLPPEAVETAVRKRLASEAATLEDAERAAELIDVTYDAEAWAGLDLADVRDRLEAIGTDPG